MSTKQFDNLSLLRQFLSDENNASQTRRTHPSSSNSTSGHLPVGSIVPHHSSTALEYMNAAAGPSSRESPGFMNYLLPEDPILGSCGSDYLPYFGPGFSDFLRLSFPSPDISSSTDVSCADFGLVVPQFATPSFLLSTEPDKGCHAQRTLSDFAEAVGGGSGSKHSELWKFYDDNFKRNEPLVQKRFKKEVGSVETAQASLRKRKDLGRYVCPFDGVTFTRKQNLKYHIQSHLGIKEYECSCGSDFNTFSGLRRHQKKCRSHGLSP